MVLSRSFVTLRVMNKVARSERIKLSVFCWRIFICLAFCFPHIAFAEEIRKVTFTPPTTDYSIVFLGNIFGIVEGILAGSGSQLMGEMFSVFNAAIIALGGMYVMYAFFASVIKTAHVGEFLGRKWSTVWTPVRIIGSFILLVPKASGYCLAQVIVMWIIVQGVGFGDLMWNTGLDYVKRGGVILTPRSNIQSGQQIDQSALFGGADINDLAVGNDKTKVAGELLQSAICMYAIEKTLKDQREKNLQNGVYSIGDQNDPGSIPNFFSNIDFVTAQQTAEDVNAATPGSTAKPTVYFPSFSATSPYASLNGVCGSVSWSLLTAADEEAIKKNIRGALSASEAQQINQARAIATQQMFLDLTSSAVTIVNNYLDATDENPALKLGYSKNGAWQPADALMQGDELQNASIAYYAIMRPVLNAIQNNLRENTDFVEEAKKHGWIMAGAYYLDLIRTQGNINDIKDNIGSVQPSIASLSNLRQSDAMQSLLFNGQISYDGLNTIAEFYDDYDPVAKELKKYIDSAISFKKISSQGSQSLGFKWVGFDWNLKTMPNIKEKDCPSGGGIKKAIGWLCKYVYNEGIVKMVNGFLDYVVSYLGNFPDNIFQPFSAILSVFYSAIRQHLQNGGDPIAALSSLGNLYINVASAVFLQSILFTTLLGSIPLIGKVIMAVQSVIGPLIIFLCATMWGTGLTLVYYLPMIPYLVFTLSAFGWMVQAVEVMVIAPVLAISMAYSEQHEIFGAAESALMSLMNVFLRPALMIIGFFIAIMLSYVGVWLVNSGFDQVGAQLIVHADAFTQIFAPLFMIIVYTTLMVSIVKNAFKMMPMFADNIMRMVGGGIQGYGRDMAGIADQIEQGMQQTGKEISEAAKQTKGLGLPDSKITRSKLNKKREGGDKKGKGEGEEKGKGGAEKGEATVEEASGEGVGETTTEGGAEAVAEGGADAAGGVAEGGSTAAEGASTAAEGASTAAEGASTAVEGAGSAASTAVEGAGTAVEAVGTAAEGAVSVAGGAGTAVSAVGGAVSTAASAIGAAATAVASAATTAAGAAWTAAAAVVAAIAAL